MADDEKKPRGNPNWKKADEPVNARETHEDREVEAYTANSHAMDDMRAYGKELSDEEFRKIAEGGRGMMFQSVMPDPPEIEGYDTMWGTTMTDSQGQLRTLLQNGYSFVTPEECPYYRNFTPRSAGLDGVVSYNELVALKIKKGRRQMLAKRNHHDLPLAYEAAIKNNISALSDSAKQNVKVEMEKGMRSMGQAPAKNPTFSL